MVKVRLARSGSKKRPFYHIVVTDKENARDGRFLEQLGYYDPRRPITEVKVDTDRLEYWVGVGAQVSERVGKVVGEHRRATQTASA